MKPSEIIQAARATAKLTQGELADRLGIARNTINRWEMGLREPTHAEMERVAAATGHRLVLELKRLRK